MKLARTWLALWLCGICAAQAPADAGLQAVEAIGLTVADLDRSIAFFTEVLDFDVLDTAELTGTEHEQLHGVFPVRACIARLRLGDEILELTEYLAPRGRPIPVDWRSNDAWFQHVAIVVSDMGAAYRRLREHRVEHISSGPQRLPDWNPNAGGIEAFYFRDPDGHALELIQFPEGKGDPRWQRGKRLFLGIDHTAIAVSDTERSLAYWRDALGMEVVGGSENWGIEQERLNATFGSRVRITTLRAARGPGVELLEYLSPSRSRPIPADSKACDLWYWEIRLVVGNAKAAFATLRGAHAAFVSPGPVELQDGDQLVTRDPDGHAARLRQPVR